LGDRAVFIFYSDEILKKLRLQKRLGQRAVNVKTSKTIGRSASPDFLYEVNH